MAKYRKRPVLVDAEQFLPDRLPWPVGVMDDSRSPTGYGVYTLEHTAQRFEVTPGDWIVTGTAGERYPVKAAIFPAIYEAVDD